MSAFEIKIVLDERMIPPVLASVESFAGQFFKEKIQIDKLLMAVEEAIENVLNYSVSDHLNYITITADAEGGEFTVSVIDQGRPGDYEDTLKDDERFGLTIMKNAVDCVSVENLGHGGRRQKLVKYYENMPDFAPRKLADSRKPIENAVITIREPKREEMLNVCRIIYEEYGLSYTREFVYFPDRFYAEIETGRIHSVVAVDQNENIAGHFACYQFGNISGILEAGMAVVSGHYRNSGIFRKLMKSILEYASDGQKGRLVLGGCVTLHPYSLMNCLDFGMTPCGFNFNLFPPFFFIGSFKKENQYSHEAYAGKALFFGERTIYAAEELVEPFKFILDGLKLKRSIYTEKLTPQAEYTKSKWDFNELLRIGSITVDVIGNDCAKKLGSDCLELRTRGAETVTLTINACDQGFNTLYEAAKAEGFFFTALLPNGDESDFVTMQRCFARSVDYDSIVTVEPYTTLLNMIRRLDPDQRLK